MNGLSFTNDDKAITAQKISQGPTEHNPRLPLPADGARISCPLSGSAMTPHNIELLITVLGALAGAAMGLGAIKIIVSAWIRKKELTAGEGEVEKLVEAVEALRSETAYMRDQLGAEISDVHERLEFAERMLTRGSSDNK